MAEISREEMIARFSRGTLSDSERRALYQAALADQELFDTLAEEEALRDLLDSPQAANALRTRLQKGPLRRSAVPRFVMPLAAAAALAVAAVVGLLVWRPPAPDVLTASRDVPEAGALWADTDAVAKSLAPLEARLELAPGSAGPRRFQPRDALRLQVSARSDAMAVILLQGASGSPRLLYPAEGSAPVRIAAGAPLTLEPGRAPATAGQYLLRMIAVRAEGVSDLASFRARVAAGEAAVIDVDFEVAR